MSGPSKAGVNAFTWEENFPRSWDSIFEDDEGRIRTSLSYNQNYASTVQSNQFKTALLGQMKRGMVRHTCLVLDASFYANERDYLVTFSTGIDDATPTVSRMDAILSICRQFTLDYFDQNPISHLGYIIARDGVAEILSDMSSHAESHLSNLSMLHLNNLERKGIVSSDPGTESSGNYAFECKGNPSLQNSLLLAKSQLVSLSTTGKASKEIIILFSGLMTVDPFNIFNTIQDLKKDLIRVSIICLSAELRICETICKETQGTFAVAMNEDHLKDLLLACTTPFPLNSAKSSWKLLRMGFPTRKKENSPTLCACHAKLTSEGYFCPQCSSKACQLPTDCSICGLTLVSAPHLARSYHHLFLLPEFVASQNAMEWRTESCLGCQQYLDSESSATLAYRCPDCSGWFCPTCNKFLHTSMHFCPGCFARKIKSSCV